MEKLFVKISHIDQYGMIEQLRPGNELLLKKDHNSRYDDEAILAVTDHGTKCGYVANSTATVCRGTHSAGYIYRMFQEETPAVIRFISVENGFVIAELTECAAEGNET